MNILARVPSRENRYFDFSFCVPFLYPVSETTVLFRVKWPKLDVSEWGFSQRLGALIEVSSTSAMEGNDNLLQKLP
jgi:hypothetical protein